MNSQNPPPHYPDPEAHEPGCLSLGGAEADSSDPGRYVDIFCDCHRYTEPKILSNGTDIAWPAGWNPVQALEWRRAHDLQLPIEA
jgi:hypothetical protein